jgi:hypothetical protein
LRNITLIFLPSKCDPFNEGQVLKAIVQNIIVAKERNDELKLNVLQTMNVIMASWQKVSSNNCFRKAAFFTTEMHSEED